MRKECNMILIVVYVLGSHSYVAVRTHFWDEVTVALRVDDDCIVFKSGQAKSK